MASKSKKRRRALGASCILAALIIAGSSFAWFTSKDEVANRLTATADYGVSIVEDFKPPKAMTPGENVNKDVSVVNTGSIDAFARVALENQLTITTYDSDDFTIDSFVDTTKTYYKTKKTTTTIGTTAYDTQSAAEDARTDTSTQSAFHWNTGTGADGKYYIKTVTEETLANRYVTATARDAELATLEASTPDIGTANTPGSTVYDYAADTDEVVNSIKSCTVTNPTGGFTNGVTLSATESLNQETGKLTANEVTTLQAGGTIVMAGNTILSKAEQFVVAGDDTTPPAQTDYDGAGQYKPSTAGLYIFKRTVYEGTSNDETKYSGYYYDGSGNFYALKTEVDTTAATGSTATPYIDFGTGHDGFTLDADGQITDIDGTVSLLTKSTYKTADMGGVNGTDLATITPTFGKLTLTNGAADGFVAASAAEVNDPAKVNAVKLSIATEGTANGTVIYIKLADDWSTNWKIVEPTSETASVADWFYYKDTVKSGETTEKLVDYVRIDNTTNQTDYVDITYDLNVVLESAQITHNNEGDETADAVVAPWATPTLTTTPVDSNGSVSTITAVDWN